MLTIPSRFSSEVRQHLFLNYAAVEGQPLILGIFGQPGEGKTFQLRSLLSDATVDQFSVSAADLESDRAGQPGKLVITEYVKAAHSIASGKAAALVIDDIDTTVGEWSQNTGTVNHQQVLAQLMHLADRPESIERIGIVRRVPVFLTGNDPGKIYAPLRRPGRMAVMLWQPTSDEKRRIADSIFQEILSPKEIDYIFAQYQHRPVAFLAQLRIAAVRRVSASVINRSTSDLGAVIRQPEQFRRLIRAALSSTTDIFFEALCEEAQLLEAATNASERSYLPAMSIV
jgi:SpoVK/Ycf46/Vps4 family AAA+-type ATPase